MTQPIDEDAYVNAFYYFHKALTTLADSPANQCRSMDYFNVAWEIKNDVINNGEAVLNTVNVQLSERQKGEIKHLLKDIAAIPNTVTNVANLQATQLQAMSDPSWIPLRTLAKLLLSVLSAEANRVNAVLNLNGLSPT